MIRSRLLPAAFLSALAAAGLGATLRAAPLVVNTLALSGQQAPGYAAGFATYDGSTRNAFSDPRAGEDGRITFTANLTGPTISTTNAGASFIGTNSANVQPILRGGDAVPNAPTGTLWYHPGEGMTEGANNTSYPYALTLPTSAGGFSATQSSTYKPFATPAYSFAIAIGQPGSLTTVGVPGTAAPGGTNLVYNGNTLQLAAQSNGNYVFTADVSTSVGTTSQGINLFAGSSTASPRLVASFGQAAPGYAAGTIFQSFDGTTHSFRDRLLIGPSGQLATNAQLSSASGNDYGLFTAPAGGTLAPILKNGDVLPGTGGRTASTTSGMSGLNNYTRSGSLYVHASYTNSSGATDAALYQAGSGGLTPVLVGTVQNADNLPTNNRALLTYTAAQSRVNSSGQVALRGFAVTGASNGTITASGYFVKPAGGNLVCVAYTGGTAPGGPTFAGLPGSFAQDDLGDVVFAATLTGTGITANNDFAYYLWQNGSLFKLLGEGDVLQVAPGDFRTITDGGLQLTTGITFESTNLSPDGLFAFRAVFTDGTSGVFALNVPEPSAGLLTLAGVGVGLGVAARRRRQTRRG